MNTPVFENHLIERLADGLPRSRSQVGTLQESDAELVRLPGTGTVLAFTTDSIAEEIEISLYDDPYLIGWMAVIVNASDLAAVGATPLGILLSETLPAGLSDDYRLRLQGGIRDACAACELPVFGGDTNTATHLQVGATAIGTVEGRELLTRVGCVPGDLLFATGPLGLGSCFALARLSPGLVPDGTRVDYRPAPRLREGRTLRSIATACMDTSDGALAAIDQLMRINDVGFVLDLSQALHTTARRLTDHLRLPPWMMLAGLHGEFELLFTIPQAKREELMTRAVLDDLAPVPVGFLVDEPGVWIESGAGRSALDTGRIRNLFTEPLEDFPTLIGRLKTMEEPCTQ